MFGLLLDNGAFRVTELKDSATNRSCKRSLVQSILSYLSVETGRQFDANPGLAHYRRARPMGRSLNRSRPQRIGQNDLKRYPVFMHNAHDHILFSPAADRVTAERADPERATLAAPTVKTEALP